MTITLTGIIIAVVLITFFVFGMKTGLIKSVFDLLAFFLTWALTWIFYPHLAALLLNTPFGSPDSVNGLFGACCGVSK